MLRRATLAFLAIPIAANAHHSFGALYDLSTFVEINGDVVSVSWMNPHIRVVLDANGTTWTIEGQASNQLARMNVTSELLRAGDSVRLAGHPGRRSANTLYLSHLLLADGREVIMRPNLESRWSDQLVGDDALITSDGTNGNAEAGIFRVWTTNVAVRTNFPLAAPRNYPLTETAREHQRAWNIEQRILNCSSYGMPTIIDSPDPIEFIDEGNSILMRLESFNAERRIYLTETGENVEPSPMGYSTGRWEGETLAVTTTHIDWPYFNQLGVPQSSNAELIEFFMPSATRLNYRLVVTDPLTFTEPVALSKYWTWHEGVRIETYEDDPDCEP
jgi:hypothetical protein